MTGLIIALLAIFIFFIYREITQSQKQKNQRNCTTRGGYAALTASNIESRQKQPAAAANPSVYANHAGKGMRTAKAMVVLLIIGFNLILFFDPIIPNFAFLIATIILGTTLKPSAQCQEVCSGNDVRITNFHVHRSDYLALCAGVWA
mmetsp:Transcript_5733/g.9783  ORF Transcript_5733/g.9783 Transcript_5733/m.9783 type:complete len:147 (+) Transcript_5733:405-845(+)